MTYVSCYYHAFQGAQQVGHPQYQPQPQYPSISYKQVTKTFPKKRRSVFFSLSFHSNRPFVFC